MLSCGHNEMPKSPGPLFSFIQNPSSYTKGLLTNEQGHIVTEQIKTNRVYVARKIYVHLERLSFLREVKSVRRLFFPVVC